MRGSGIRKGALLLWAPLSVVVASALVAGCSARPDDGDPDADVPEDAESDADADAELDADADARPDADPESPAFVDPACVEGHDPERPVLVVTALVGYLPFALAVPQIRDLMADMVESGELTVLVTLEDLEPDGSATFELRGGERLEDGSYRYREDVEGWGVDVAVDGRSFGSDPEGVSRLVTFGAAGASISLPLHELVVSGVFNTEERCSFGEPLPPGLEPAWRLGASLVGKITVEDARVTEATLLGASALVCDLLCGDVVAEGCGAPMETWRYPPDTVVGEEPAWTVDFRLAATAVQLVP